MKIIYHCYGGAHSSVTAAAIHLNQLPQNLVPKAEEFYNLRMYDWQTKENHGNIYYMGTDGCNNEIYILGRRTMHKIVETLAKDTLKMMNISHKEIMLVDASRYTNLMMRIGGILSRRLGFVKYGKPLVIRGTQKAYLNVAALVREVKKKVESRE